MQIKNYTFESEPVLMDYHQFQGCTFKRCRLVYCGYSPVQFDGCRFDDCRWEFSGPAAATLHLLSSFNHVGGEMGKLIVKQALAIINQPPAQPGGPAPAGATPGAPVAAPPLPPPAAPPAA